MNGRVEQHRKALDLIVSVDAEVKIVIPGNHDLTLDREYYAQWPILHSRGEPYSSETLDEIYELYTGPQARQAGIYYVVEGVADFTLKSGAKFTVYASAYQPEFYNWAFGYPRSQDRYNYSPTSSAYLTGANKLPENPIPDHGEIDIMITHGPPSGILDLNWDFRTERPRENCGCEFLRKAVQRCRPRVHCFGHIHEGWGCVRKRWDLDSREEAADAHGGGLQSLAGGKEKQAAPLPPYHPQQNPSAYYMYAHQAASQQTNLGETLIPPGKYHETQIPQMCAKVDATDLEFGKETLFVNASIMNLRYRPINAPWLVDLMLPVAEGEGGEEIGQCKE